MGPPAAGAPLGGALRRAARGRRVPDGLGAVEGGRGGAPGDPATPASTRSSTTELSFRVYGTDLLEDVPGPVIFYSNHSSHLDATLIMCSLPERWQKKTAVGAARDYFFDVWWRQAFTALVYGAFPIDRGRGGTSGDRQGARARRRRVVDRRVPGGNALARRAHAAVPSRGVAAGDRARRRARADRDRRCVPGDAEGSVLAEAGPAGRHDALRRAAVPRGRRVAPVAVGADAAGRDGAVRRGPDELVRRDRAGRARRDAVARRPDRRGLAAHVGGLAAGAAARPPEDLGDRAMPRTGGERRRTTLVEEAIRQFGTEGYAGASLDSIAQAVGVRKQTLLYYFPNKDALLEACLAAAGQRVAEEITSALEASTDPGGARRGGDPRGLRARRGVAGVPDVHPRGGHGSARTRSIGSAVRSSRCGCARSGSSRRGWTRARSASRTRRCCCSRCTRR